MPNRFINTLELSDSRILSSGTSVRFLEEELEKTQVASFEAARETLRQKGKIHVIDDGDEFDLFGRDAERIGREVRVDRYEKIPYVTVRSKLRVLR